MVRREDLERYLERGAQLGFVKETDSEDFLGWILLEKRKPHDRYLSLLAPGEDPRFVKEQERIRSLPYQVRVIELRRDVYESGVYETNEDYRLHEIHHFADLEGVDSFVRQFGYALENIKWSAEIDSP